MRSEKRLNGSCKSLFQSIFKFNLASLNKYTGTRNRNVILFGLFRAVIQKPTRLLRVVDVLRGDDIFREKLRNTSNGE